MSRMFCLEEWGERTAHPEKSRGNPNSRAISEQKANPGAKTPISFAA